MSKITKIGIPPSGTTGQVLKKKSGANYDVEWGTGGGGSGTVTSVATTAPITGGTITTTGTIGITQATTSTDGYLSSTDWNTFNNKQSALTNPITGTGTTNYLPKFTGTSTIGNSTIQDLTTGVLVSPSVTAASGVAIGTSMTPSLTASANNDTLIGLKVTPTFTTGAYTGVTSIGAILESTNHRLEFYSTSSVLGVLNIKRGLFGTGTGDNGSYRLAFFNSGVAYIDASTSTGEFKTVVPNTFFYTWTINTERMRLSTAGNFLINTTTDSGFKLDVNGLVNFTGTTASDGGQLGAELLSAAGWTSTGWTGSFGAGWTHTVGNTTALTNTLAAVTNNYYQISYTVTGRTAGTFVIAFGGYTSGSLSATGNVGPRATSTGTLSITPTTDFDGTIVISIKQVTSSSASVTLKNSAGTVVNQIRSFSSNTNIGIGVNSGTILTTGVSNTFVGYSAGSANTSSNSNSFFGANAGLSNTIGNSNSFYGNFSGTNTTTGSNNSFYGSASGQNNTTASSNCFFGTNSGLSNTTGAGNSYFGLNSGLNNILGSSNTFIGGSSGRFISSGGSLTSINNSTFLGVDTRANADSETNQTVIGYQAIGLGSNTTVIGNSSTTFGRWWGNLLVGTSTNGGFTLDINGTSRFQNDITISDTRNIIINTTTGTKIGTATTQKIGFFGSTPIVQPSAVTTVQGLSDAISSLGLLASSTIASSSGVGDKLYLFNSY